MSRGTKQGRIPIDKRESVKHDKKALLFVVV